MAGDVRYGNDMLRLATDALTFAKTKDANGDGKINREEFRQIWNLSPDDAGKPEFNNLFGALAQNGVNMALDAAASTLQQFDANLDGKLDQQEKTDALTEAALATPAQMPPGLDAQHQEQFRSMVQDQGGDSATLFRQQLNRGLESFKGQLGDGDRIDANPNVALADGIIKGLKDGTFNYAQDYGSLDTSDGRQTIDSLMTAENLGKLNATGKDNLAKTLANAGLLTNDGKSNGLAEKLNSFRNSGNPKLQNFAKQVDKYLSDAWKVDNQGGKLVSGYRGDQQYGADAQAVENYLTSQQSAPGRSAPAPAQRRADTTTPQKRADLRPFNVAKANPWGVGEMMNVNYTPAKGQGNATSPSSLEDMQRRANQPGLGVTTTRDRIAAIMGVPPESITGGPDLDEAYWVGYVGTDPSPAEKELMDRMNKELRMKTGWAGGV